MTILFSISDQKYSNQALKFNDFSFCNKLFNKTNSRTHISNMTIAFSNCSPKNTQITHFWSQFQAFLQLDKFGVLFSNMTIIFSNSISKSSNKAFLVLSRLLFLLRTLQQNKFEDADFTYGNIIFKFHPKNTQIRHFWSQI